MGLFSQIPLSTTIQEVFLKMRYLAYILILLGALVCISCSSGASNPIASGNQANSIGTLPVIAFDGSGAIGMMGAYGVSVNPDEMTFDITPLRTSAIGESYIVSGKAFFTMTPCSDCLQIDNISMDLDGNIVLGLSVKHPFPKGDALKPPTAANRLDLDVFDLAVVMLPVEATADIYSLTGVQTYPGVLVNADGYTTELANVVDDVSALPYKICFEDANNNRFEMDTDYQPFDMVINPGAGLNFEFWLTMGYGASAKKPQRLEPEYYVPEFNRKAAWKVAVTPPEGEDPPAMGNTWNDSDTSTDFTVTVDVYDWNHGATIAVGEYPDPANPDHISASSDISEVTVEVPGMTSAIVSASTIDTTQNGWDDPLTYTASFPNENDLDAGVYQGLVKVTDSRNPGTSTVGGETDTLVHAPDGIILEWCNMNEFATYQTFPATVVIGCGPVTGSITDPVCPITSAANGQTIDFTVTASSANGGDPVVLYEVDFDYDGMSFTMDDSNTDGDFQNVGPFTVPDPCATNIPLTFTVAFRGTDSCTPPNETIFATCEVTVDTCLEPVGNVTITVNRTSNSYGYPFDETGPWTLDWDTASGAVEYAIYFDNDPSDGLLSDFQPLGVTTTNSYTVPSGHIPANHYIIGYTYVVRSRSEIGNPLSEAVDSEPAFISTCGFETMSWWGQNPGEGWTTNCQRNSSGYYYRPFTYIWDPVSFWAYNPPHGTKHCWMSPYSGANYNNRWVGLTKETPVVPDATVRHMELSTRHFQTYSPGGLIFGTSSSQPSYNWASGTTDIEWASVESSGNFTGYNTNSADVQSTFDDVPDTLNAWVREGSIFKTYGGDLNVDGNPDDPYVAIEFVKLNTHGTQPYIFIDEIAICIY
jgi:hypothetical protein